MKGNIMRTFRSDDKACSRKKGREFFKGILCPSLTFYRIPKLLILNKAALLLRFMWLKFFTANIFLWEAAIYHRHGYLGLLCNVLEKYAQGNF